MRGPAAPEALGLPVIRGVHPDAAGGALGGRRTHEGKTIVAEPSPPILGEDHQFLSATSTVLKPFFRRGKRAGVRHRKHAERPRRAHVHKRSHAGRTTPGIRALRRGSERARSYVSRHWAFFQATRNRMAAARRRTATSRKAWEREREAPGAPMEPWMRFAAHVVGMA